MNHKKHLTSWFTTSAFRAINLALVTDVYFNRTNGTISGARVYQAVPDGSGQASLQISEEDARKLFDLLV
jgi:hypothetical protein